MGGRRDAHDYAWQVIFFAVTIAGYGWPNREGRRERAQGKLRESIQLWAEMGALTAGGEEPLQERIRLRC
jgi:hypothetical protein